MTETKIDIDKAKGRVKEAAGVLTDDQHLKNEGRVDQARSSAKNAVDKVAGTLRGLVDTLTGHKKSKP
jgi:uncharacterized protein YjbJ (UPF0337 family)